VIGEVTVGEPPRGILEVFDCKRRLNNAPLLGDFPVQASNNMEVQAEVIDEYRMTINNASVARPRFNGVAV
jgi:hypothetical protein